MYKKNRITFNAFETFNVQKSTVNVSLLLIIVFYLFIYLHTFV